MLVLIILVAVAVWMFLMTKYLYVLHRVAAAIVDAPSVRQRLAIVMLLLTLPSIAIAQPRSYDADGVVDVAVFRPSAGQWWIRYSGGTGPNPVVWGGSGDTPVPGDYDGDGKTDVAVFRSSTGTWFIRQSINGSLASVAWGTAGDVPVAADYDGDGKADVAVFRPSTGAWYIRYSNGGAAGIVWGQLGDLPVVGDFNGDGKAEVTVFRPSTGAWYVNYPALGFSASAVWGQIGDIPVAGDFDGDGRMELAVFRPSTGQWWIRYSGGTGPNPISWGSSSDTPEPADYDGDGVMDVAVFRPSTGQWWIRYSGGAGPNPVVWGGSDDVPVVKTPTPTVAPAPPPPPTSPSPAPPSPPPPTEVNFGAGKYRVGGLPNLPAGRYYTDPIYGCYWERLNGLGGTSNEIIANNFVGYDAAQQIVDIRSTDFAFSTDADCGTWYSTPRRGLQTNITPGMWLVGSQVTPGTYMSYVGYGCYWERLRNFDGTLSAIIANDFVDSPGYRYVQVSAGDVGFQSDGDCGTWQPVSGASVTLSRSVNPDEPSPGDIEQNRKMQRRKAGLPD
jgi:hypothetical protein